MFLDGFIDRLREYGVPASSRIVQELLQLLAQARAGEMVEDPLGESHLDEPPRLRRDAKSRPK